MNEKEIQHLESINSFYEKGDYFDELIIEKEIEIIKRYALDDKEAIEIGCGSGYSTERLYKIFKTLEVIEPSTKNISLLKKKLPNIICYNTLLENFVPKKQYDCILFLNILEHVENPVESLKSLKKFLTEDGVVFISVPNCMSLNRRVGKEFGMIKEFDEKAPKDIEVGHRTLYTIDLLEEHCIQADYTIKDAKGIYLKPFSQKQMEMYDEQTIKAFHEVGEDYPELCACILITAQK